MGFSYKSDIKIAYQDNMRFSNIVPSYHFHVAVTQFSKHRVSL